MEDQEWWWWWRCRKVSLGSYTCTEENFAKLVDTISDTSADTSADDCRQARPRAGPPGGPLCAGPRQECRQGRQAAASEAESITSWQDSGSRTHCQESVLECFAQGVTSHRKQNSENQEPGLRNSAAVPSKFKLGMSLQRPELGEDENDAGGPSEGGFEV